MDGSFSTRHLRRTLDKASEMPHFFVRIGAMGEVHPATSTRNFARGEKVILRTGKGLQWGRVLGERVNPLSVPPKTPPDKPASTPDVEPVAVLRAVTDQDEMLIRRLQKRKPRAIESCRQLLAESGSKSILLDVDQLFDGGALVMHFLGPVDSQAEALASTVAASYESVVQTSKLARQLTEGCGPDCGTQEGAGCGSACSTCAVASACRKPASA